jgi:hypothetical protein
MNTETDTKKVISFIKSCLLDEGYSKELVTYLLSTYDLDTFISNSNLHKLQLATHFLGHARSLDYAARNY